MGVITVKPSDGVTITDNSVEFPINDTYCDKTYEVTYTDTKNKCKCKRTVVQQSLSCSNSTTFATGYTSGSTNVCTAHTVTLTVPPQQYTAYTRTRVDCDTCSETSSTGITNSYNITVNVSEYTGSGTRIVSGWAGNGNKIYYEVSQSGGCITCPESSTTYGSTSFTASVHCSATTIWYEISNVPYTSVTYTRSADGRKCNSASKTGREDIYVSFSFTNSVNTGTTNKTFTGTVPDYPNIRYTIYQLAEEACYCCENFSVEPVHYSFSGASTQLGTCGIPSCDIPTGNVTSIVVEGYYTTSALTDASSDTGWLHDLCYVYDSGTSSSPRNRFKGMVNQMSTSTYGPGNTRWAKVTATYNCNGGTGTYSWPVGQFFQAPS